VTIRTELTPEWQSVLDALPEAEQHLLIAEADNLANAIKYRNPLARISTNGALEILFAIGCAQNNRKGNRNE
jgi:hypothetical protein